jgi:hypothetical protein
MVLTWPLSLMLSIRRRELEVRKRVLCEVSFFQTTMQKLPRHSPKTDLTADIKPCVLFDTNQPCTPCCLSSRYAKHLQGYSFTTRQHRRPPMRTGYGRKSPLGSQRKANGRLPRGSETCPCPIAFSEQKHHDVWTSFIILQPSPVKIGSSWADSGICRVWTASLTAKVNDE